ncbi:MAG: amino acid racemase [Hyphomicrobiales bacterium]|nr:amino acid racemase [Hyphomicrobiales bacterium]
MQCPMVPLSIFERNIKAILVSFYFNRQTAYYRHPPMAEKRQTMKKIGLIGGLSWISTAHYYRRLNQITQEKAGGVHSVSLVLESVDRQDYVDAVIHREDEAAACEQILKAAQCVEKAGAEFIVISCNDVHRFVPDIKPYINIQFLHIAEVTAQAIKTQNLNNVALLGVNKTMDGDFYQAIMESHNINVIIPSQQEKAYIHDKIFGELVVDIFTQDTRQGYLEIINALASRGAEGVILGCTEIPMLLDAQDIAIPSFSTTELHCRAAVEKALGE